MELGSGRQWSAVSAGDYIYSKWSCWHWNLEAWKEGGCYLLHERSRGPTAAAAEASIVSSDIMGDQHTSHTLIFLYTLVCQDPEPPCQDSHRSNSCRWKFNFFFPIQFRCMRASCAPSKKDNKLTFLEYLEIVIIAKHIIWYWREHIPDEHISIILLFGQQMGVRLHVT